MVYKMTPEINIQDKSLEVHSQHKMTLKSGVTGKLQLQQSYSFVILPKDQWTDIINSFKYNKVFGSILPSNMFFCGFHRKKLCCDQLFSLSYDDLWKSHALL